MESTRSTRAVAAACTVAALGLYAATAAPDLGLVDSGELALACTTGGVAHPPGVPLYLLVGGLAAKLPIASPVRNLNLLSALFMALAAGGVFLAVERWLAIAGGGESGGADETRSSEAAPTLPGGAATLRILAALVASAGFFTSYDPWTWASVTEVYALNVFLQAGAWYFAARAAVQLGAGKKISGSRSGRRSRKGAAVAVPWGSVTAACTFACLGIANHHATTIPTLIALSVFLVIGAPALLRRPRFWGTFGGALAFSLALYLYLFRAAARDPALSWGGIESLPLLVRHVLGTQYQVQAGAVPAETVRVLREFFDVLVFGAGIPMALLALGGFAFGIRSVARRAARRGALLAGVPLLLIGLNVLLSVNYVAGPEDRMAYDLPSQIAWALLAGLGTSALVRWVWQSGRKSDRGVAGAAGAAFGLAALVVAWNVGRNFDACNLRPERTARTFVEEMLATVPERGLVITSEWNFYAPYLYLRTVEGYRRDLRVVDVLMMRRFWYLDYLEREMPDLVERSRPEFDAFREQVTRFDLGLPYDQQRIQGLYDGLVRRWVEIGKDDARAFVDWSTLRKPQEVSWLRTLATTPDGLLLRFTDPPVEVPAPIPSMDAANLAWVRSKLTERTLAGDLSDLAPRHDPYRKVWSAYANAVETSLLLARQRGGEEEVRRLAALYDWFPEIERATANVRVSTASVPDPASPNARRTPVRERSPRSSYR